MQTSAFLAHAAIDMETKIYNAMKQWTADLCGVFDLRTITLVNEVTASHKALSFDLSRCARKPISGYVHDTKGIATQ